MSSQINQTNNQIQQDQNVIWEWTLEGYQAIGLEDDKNIKFGDYSEDEEF